MAHGTPLCGKQRKQGRHARQRNRVLLPHDIAVHGLFLPVDAPDFGEISSVHFHKLRNYLLVLHAESFV